MNAVTTTTISDPPASTTRRPVMISEQRPMAWPGIALPVLAIVVAGGIVLGLAAARWSTRNFEGVATSLGRHESALTDRITTMDAALARRDLSRAIHEWRDAYGLALGLRRWEAMAAVGDAALRIDALASQPAGPGRAFRAEARQAYLRALFSARRVGSREGVLRVAEAFAALGDAEMAARVRALAVDR
jgi:hypothetical protein